MVAVLAPMVDAARLPRVCPLVSGYKLPALFKLSEHGTVAQV